MDLIDNYIKIGLEFLGPILPFVLIIVVASYVFWSDAKVTGKDRNSVFDMYIIAILFMIIWGRIMFILANIEDFTNLPWSISPYERYSDGIFFFRLLPWKYFNIWNGGVLELQLFPMFVSYVIFSSIYSFVVKRWRWREMMGAIMSSSTVAFSLILIISGIFSEYYEVYRYGLGLFIIIFITQSISYIMYNLFQRNREKSHRIYFMWTLISTISIIGYLLMFTISIPLADTDMWHMYAYLIWGGISLVIYIFDMNRKVENIKTIIKSKPMITPNTPVRM